VPANPGDEDLRRRRHKPRRRGEEKNKNATPRPGCRRAEPSPVGTLRRPGVGVFLLFFFSALSASPRFIFFLRRSSAPRALLRPGDLSDPPFRFGKPRKPTENPGPGGGALPAKGTRWRVGEENGKKNKPRRRGERGEEKKERTRGVGVPLLFFFGDPRPQDPPAPGRPPEKAILHTKSGRRKVPTEEGSAWRQPGLRADFSFFSSPRLRVSAVYFLILRVPEEEPPGRRNPPEARKALQK